MCVVCARAPAACTAAAAAAAALAGGGSSSGPGAGERRVNRPLKVKSHSRYDVRPTVLGFSELMGQDVSSRAPPPCLRGPEQGQVVGSAGGDRECPACRTSGTGRSVHKVWRD